MDDRAAAGDLPTGPRRGQEDAGDVLPHHFLDTTVLPPPDRLASWMEMVAQDLAPAHITTPHRDDFVASARLVDLGRIRLTALRYSSLRSDRPARLVRRTEADVYQLALPLVGRSSLTQERQDAQVGTAEFTFLDMARPYLAVHDGAGPQLAATLTVQVPHRDLPLSPDRVRRLLATRISTDTGMAALLAQLLRRVATRPHEYAAAQAGPLAGIVLDLVAATLAEHLDREGDLPVQVRQGALREKIVAFVEQHLDDVRLTPAAVAAEHHISLRTLHRLFADQPAGLAALIRDRRLERCRRELRNPLLAGQPVQAVAARWGFGDKAHFSRLFRARYGCSPREYRRGDGP
ncbi:helix-turn-helix domain-containing protein [Micromonospora mirobrigensis]|uniref:AraC-type DNA-binding protein n=1 Tax=Micromonospora mirobrigensis TaxID=262898 RepID=A0A1C4YFW5_9ACTN|nr:helix-turn-helix domain-containing protein [Micromonospora mirobrigensis]SCF19617.1 AraC-type DNA-binding protein [Micromonospora mirobrigensis]